MKKSSRHYLFLFFIFYANLGFAAEDKPLLSAPSTNGAFAQALLGLGVVVLLIFSLAWLLKRLNFVGLNQNKQIKIITVAPLGTREKAVLIDVQGQQILVGVAPGRVSTLHVFERSAMDADVKIDELDEDDAKIPSGRRIESKSMVSSLGANSASEFSKKLNAFLGVGNKP